MIRINEKEYPWKEGMTVMDSIENLSDPNYYMVARFNKTRVCRPLFDKTLVPDGSDIYLIPLLCH